MLTIFFLKVGNYKVELLAGDITTLRRLLPEQESVVKLDAMLPGVLGHDASIEEARELLKALEALDQGSLEAEKQYFRSGMHPKFRATELELVRQLVASLRETPGVSAH